MSFAINHDLHTHTFLSSCCADERMTPKNIADEAIAMNYDVLCLTDHLWDSAVPGASVWYAPQDIEHVSKSLPLPNTPKLKLVFGCEIEYCGGDRLSLAPQNYDRFDWIVVAPNHFHMAGLTRPVDMTDPADRAALYMDRLEELLTNELPWYKVGIAHFTCGLLYREGDVREVLRRLDPTRLSNVFRQFAARGVGMELNASSLRRSVWAEDPEGYLWPYRLAKEAGCKFYCASDAHTMESLRSMNENIRDAVEALALTEADQFILRRD